MKKFLGIILAGVMVMSLSVFAFATESGSDGADNTEDNTGNNTGNSTVTEGESSSSWSTCKCPQPCPSVIADGECGCPFHGTPDCSCDGGSSDSGEGGGEGYDEDYAAEALAAKEMGLSMDILQGAADANKSVGEYLNNSVNSVAGIANVTPVAQGGAVIINGQPSNQTFSVNKPLPAHIDAAKAQAVAVGGRVMNCVDVDAGVYFDVATVNFYTPGITGAENVQVYHFTSGQWIPLNVAEVREDHIVVDMTAPGVLVFIEVPAEAAE